MSSGDVPRRTREVRVVPDGRGVLDIAAVSDVGSVRTENQDGWSIVPLQRVSGCGVLLADGMGGHVGGREAALAALDAASALLRDSVEPHLAMAEAFRAADQAVGERRPQGGAVSGTTLVSAVISEGRVRIANVGDSRAYMIRGPHVVRVTEDHSVIGEQVRAGMVDPAVADSLPGKNLLTRAVTGEAAPADFFDLPMEPGDLLVLCSDGLWGVLSDEQLHAVLTGPGSLAEVADRACDAALDAGSHDNVTVVLCHRIAEV